MRTIPSTRQRVLSEPALQERSDASLSFHIGRGRAHEPADAPNVLALLSARRERPCRCTAEQSDKVAPFLIELHSVPSQGPIAGYRIARDQSAAIRIRLQPSRAAMFSPTLSSLACRAKLPSPPAGPDWIREIKHDGLACHHVQTCTDREQPTRKIVRRKQITRTSRAHSKKWHAAGCYLPSKWSGWTVRKRPKRATLPRSQEPLLIK